LAQIGFAGFHRKQPTGKARRLSARRSAAISAHLPSTRLLCASRDSIRADILPFGSDFDAF
jgi:hypothetical protein